MDARIGYDEIKVIEVIGYDTSSQMYSTRSFDSQGNSGVYQASVRDGVWTFTGESERATVVVSGDGNTMSANWERSDDGSTWLPWMDVKLTRAK